MRGDRSKLCNFSYVNNVAEVVILRSTYGGVHTTRCQLEILSRRLPLHFKWKTGVAGRAIDNRFSGSIDRGCIAFNGGRKTFVVEEEEKKEEEASLSGALNGGRGADAIDDDDAGDGLLDTLRVCRCCLRLLTWSTHLRAKLSSIHMTRLHASTKTPSSSHLRGCKEFQEGQDVKCHCHMKACKISSPDGSGSTSRSDSIQEFSESFEKQLHFKIKRSVSLDEDSDPCVICHDDLENGSIVELHCMHSFHKECIEKWLLKKPTCPTCRIHVLMSNSILDLHQPG
ncbi:unnamed protein product [Caretta caretta]